MSGTHPIPLTFGYVPIRYTTKYDLPSCAFSTAGSRATHNAYVFANQFERLSESQLVVINNTHVLQHNRSGLCPLLSRTVPNEVRKTDKRQRRYFPSSRIPPQGGGTLARGFKSVSKNKTHTIRPSNRRFGKTKIVVRVCVIWIFSYTVISFSANTRTVGHFSSRFHGDSRLSVLVLPSRKCKPPFHFTACFLNSIAARWSVPFEIRALKNPLFNVLVVIVVN